MSLVPSVYDSDILMFRETQILNSEIPASLARLMGSHHRNMVRSVKLLALVEYQ